MDAQKNKYLSESLDLLRQIKGHRIVRMVRLFCGDENRFLGDFPAVARSGLFSSSGHALFVQIETVGWVAFAEREREMSVVMWQLDRLPELNSTSNADVEKTNHVDYIECSDPFRSEQYWADFLGKRISEVKIISLSVDRENVRPFRNERGLFLLNESGDDMIIETSLAKKGIPAGLNIIANAQIRAELRNDLVVQEV